MVQNSLIKKDRSVLIQELKLVINKIKYDKKKMAKIFSNLSEHNINSGQVNKIINNIDEQLVNIDHRLLYLLANEFYFASGSPDINPHDYFTDREIKKSQIFSISKNFDPIELPIKIKNVTMIDDENYIAVLDIETLSKWYNNGLLEYNVNTQREPRIVKRNDKIIEKPKIYPAAVKEITDKLLEGDLEITTITLNALVGTADDGEEILYSGQSRELTFTPGTEIDMLDGFHRLTASRNALELNSEIEHSFIVSIKNFTESKARKHLAEISKINAIDRTHIKQLEQARRSDFIVNELKRESDLKGRISNTGMIHSAKNEIVSYGVLSDSIDEVFTNIKSKFEAKEVSNYLIEFFDYLIGKYNYEFNEGYRKVSKETIFNVNVMFAGYVVLAKRLQDEGKNISILSNIIDGIDFSRDNREWVDLKILNKDGHIGQDARKKIMKYFEDLEI